MVVLTIDTGTTNTRVCLWQNSRVLGAASAGVGVRDTAITGSRIALQEAVRGAIAEVLAHASLTPADVALTLASGMFTSALGLHEVPHLLTPCGRQELADGMVKVSLPEIFSRPLWLIPGVRNHVSPLSLANCESMDMMRGEEVEVIGLLNRLQTRDAALFVMPGSHTKMVAVDTAGRIRGCATTLAGELLQTVTQNTILAATLGSEFAATLDAGMVLAGAASANLTGFGRTCFSVRILEQQGLAERNARANYLLGAVLASDLLTLKNSTALCATPSTHLIIAGSGVLQQALALLIGDDGYFVSPATVVDAACQTHLAGFGALQVAVARGLLPASFACSD